jgi:hypothetical protein
MIFDLFKNLDFATTSLKSFIYIQPLNLIDYLLNCEQWFFLRNHS